MRNTHQHSTILQSKILHYDENHKGRAKRLGGDDSIALSEEQILYYANLNGNENVKGNYELWYHGIS